MKAIITIILAMAINFSILGLAAAQEQAPSLYLEITEKCNNYARHYCVNGSHEAAVNRTLLEMKRRGFQITIKTIQRVARSTPSRLHNPAAETVE